LVKIKGYSFLSSRSAIESVHGKAAVQKIIDSLPPEDQLIFSNPILSHLYYPLDAYVHWLEGEVRILYDGDEAILDRRLREAMEKALKGIYSMIQRFTSPMEAVHGMAALNHQENLSVERLAIGPRRARLIYRGLHKRHAIYELLLKNWWLAVVRQTGGKDARFEPEIPIAAGRDRAEYILSWT